MFSERNPGDENKEKKVVTKPQIEDDIRMAENKERVINPMVKIFVETVKAGQWIDAYNMQRSPQFKRVLNDSDRYGADGRPHTGKSTEVIRRDQQNYIVNNLRPVMQRLTDITDRQEFYTKLTMEIDHYAKEQADREDVELEGRYAMN